MATLKDRPYAQFNFLVDLGGGRTRGPQAGFQEISGLDLPASVDDCREGDRNGKSAAKITGLNKTTDVTLKRGVIGASHLHRWLDDIRQGKSTALRTVTISLQSEDHTEAVQSWTLTRARIVKHTSGPLNAKGTDVALEELVLAYERLEMERS